MNWLFFPAFVATAMSVFGLTRIAIKHHDIKAPHTLSELAAAEAGLLQHFRLILVVCGLLFGSTVLGYIAPNTDNAVAIVIFGVLMVAGELVAALLPARHRTLLLHTVAAQVMAVGMLGLAWLFVLSASGANRIGLEIIMTVMLVTGTLTYLDKPRYIFYELTFIYCSHLSILVIALALR